LSIFWAGKWHKIGSIFLLNSHEKRPKNNKKGQKNNNNCLLSLVSLLIHKSKQKNTTKTFWRQICYRAPICLYFLSFFFPPTHLPARPQMQHAPSANACKKTANPHFIFLIQKNSFAPKILIKTKNSKQDIFKFEAPNLTLYKNTKKSF